MQAFRSRMGTMGFRKKSQRFHTKWIVILSGPGDGVPSSFCKGLNIEEDSENTYNLKCWVLRKAYTGKSQFDKTIIFFRKQTV